jgi:hypothetical protein
MLAACARKNVRHEERVRCGAGWRPSSSSTFRTEVAETGMPRPLSSPTIRLYPQSGFSRARRRIRSRSERSSGGRPGLRCAYVQRRATSWRCQRSNVSGLTGKQLQAVRGSERLSDASSARSARVSAGRAACRRRIAARAGGRGSPAPSTDAAVEATAPARTDFARPDTQTTRANSPSLDHSKSAESNEPDASESRRQVCEPYGPAPRIRSRGVKIEFVHPRPTSSVNRVCAPSADGLVGDSDRAEQRQDARRGGLELCAKAPPAVYECASERRRDDTRTRPRPRRRPADPDSLPASRWEKLRAFACADLLVALGEVARRSTSEGVGMRSSPRSAAVTRIPYQSASSGSPPAAS